MVLTWCRPWNIVLSSSSSASWFVFVLTRIRCSLIIFFSSLFQCSVFGVLQAGGVFAYIPDISSARVASSAVVDLIDCRPAIDAESTGGKEVLTDKVQGKIRLENIYFSYPTRLGARVLRGLSFDVQPGTYVALVGASGSGKSTVYVDNFYLRRAWLTLVPCSIQLIERFYDPVRGKIYVCGVR
jgi:ATP-binding cassette subfamily B (MDR/TAP) protein 1